MGEKRKKLKLQAKDQELEITAETLTALKAKWKGKDVETELHKMHLWLLRYPKRRPANIWRFIDAWLKKTNGEKGNGKFNVHAYSRDAYHRANERDVGASATPQALLDLHGKVH